MTSDLATIASGIPVTVVLTLAAFAVGAVLGLPLCAVRMAAPGALRVVAAAFILTIQAVPPIVWLFFIFFGVGSGYVQLNPFTAAVIGLGLITAANMAEIYRGALAAVHVGQWEAAFALNLNAKHTFIDVIGPQLLRIATPSAATFMIGLLKDSAIASTIGVYEIAFQTYQLSQTSFRGLSIYIAAGLLYVALSLPVAVLARWLDASLRARVAR